MFTFFRKLFCKSKVSEQSGEKEKWVVQPEPHLSHCASPALQPGTLEKHGYQLCEPLCLTPAGMVSLHLQSWQPALILHSLQGLNQVPALQAEEAVPTPAVPTPDQGYARVTYTLSSTCPTLQISAIPALLDDLFPIFPAPAFRGGLCTTACSVGIHPSKADIERDYQTSGPAPCVPCTVPQGSSILSGLPPSFACFPQEMWGVSHTGAPALENELHPQGSTGLTRAVEARPAMLRVQLFP